MLQDDARGVAVEARVVGEHGDQVLGLIGQVAGAPGAGYDDDGADITQFACDALCEKRLMIGFARGPF